MNELKTIIDILKQIGLPMLIVVVLLYICFKVAPDMLKAWQKARNDQQEHNNNRQKHYDDQMGVLLKVAEQGNQVIGRSNTIIEQNTEAMKNNTAVHEKVVDALTRDLEELRALRVDVKEHDERTRAIEISMAQVCERVGR